MNHVTKPSMSICVLLFAAFRELVGASKVELEVPVGATLEDVYRTLTDREPELSRLRHCTTFALNREVAPPSTVVSHGDEVAFLQPVSGGAV